ncbi:S41 family peptidase [Bacillota bacterium LX-D]|nr:S41 family peptidase [Bacillota bacterium LX-D]
MDKYFVKLSRFLVCFVLCFAYFAVFTPNWAQAAGKGENQQQILQEVKEHILKSFVTPVDASKLNQDNVEDMVKSLNDPYSVYFSPEDYSNFIQQTEQEFTGVGMQVELKDKYATVVLPLKNSPAERAGIKANDRILEINGENVVGKTLDYVVGLIRGEAGTVVDIKIARDGEKEPLIFTLTREVIAMDVVETKMIDQQIGYLQLTTFSTNAGEEFEEGIKKLKSQGMKALIFDLRGNPGGYLNSGLDVAAMFVRKNHILLTIVDRNNHKRSFKSLTKPLGIPTIVLVDGGTASASEIVSGAIQDEGAGRLVGTKTYGKACVQTVFQLSNGGALKLTTANYLTPKGREINKIGLKPDYVVEGEEAQLTKAVELLKQQLKSAASSISSNKVILSLQENRFIIGDQKVALKPKPYLQHGVTMVPVQGLAQALNGQVSWQKQNNQIVFRTGTKVVNFAVDKEKAVDSSYRVKMTAPVKIAQGKAYIALRYAAKFLGYTVSYDKTNQEIMLVK